MSKFYPLVSKKVSKSSLKSEFVLKQIFIPLQ